MHGTLFDKYPHNTETNKQFNVITSHKWHNSLLFSLHEVLGVTPEVW